MHKLNALLLLIAPMLCTSVACGESTTDEAADALPDTGAEDTSADPVPDACDGTPSDLSPDSGVSDWPLVQTLCQLVSASCGQAQTLTFAGDFYYVDEYTNNITCSHFVDAEGNDVLYTEICGPQPTNCSVSFEAATEWFVVPLVNEQGKQIANAFAEIDGVLIAASGVPEIESLNDLITRYQALRDSVPAECGMAMWLSAESQAWCTDHLIVMHD
jgi:hypothetical protein